MPPIDKSKWYNLWGKLIVGIKPYKNPNNWPEFNEEWAGIIQFLNCESFIDYGKLETLIPANGVSSSVLYIGGNGGSYNTQTINSTGVTGLVASLQSGFFLTGDGRVTYTISGTPSLSGTASFAIQLGGKSCTLSRVVEEQDDSFILSAQLINGDVIDGIIGSSNGYYKVQYWDGTTEIKQSWTAFQKTCTSSGNGSMGSYGPKLIKIWPCDVNGVKSGEIFDVNLTNNKYLAFTLNKVLNLRFLTVKNNQVITKSDLNFSLLTKIENITLENLPSFTGSLSFTNVAHWVLPKYYKSDWTITNNRSEWNSQNRLTSVLTITNLPITSLDLSNLGGLYSLQLRNCISLTTINTTNCTSMESFDIRESLNSLQPINLSTLTYLGSLSVENAPNVTSITLPQQPLITMLNLRYISITSLDLSAMTSLRELDLFGISTLNSTLETSFYSNTLLRTTLKSIYLDSVNFTTANFSNYSIERFMLYNLPNVASISLPSTTIYLDIHRLPSMSTSSVDSIFTQLDGFGLSNGQLGRSKYGQNDLLRTTASDSVIASLASKGWYFFGHSFQTIL
jgi:hypothetical protein